MLMRRSLDNDNTRLASKHNKDVLTWLLIQDVPMLCFALCVTSWNLSPCGDFSDEAYYVFQTPTYPTLKLILYSRYTKILISLFSYLHLHVRYYRREGKCITRYTNKLFQYVEKRIISCDIKKMLYGKPFHSRIVRTE